MSNFAAKMAFGWRWPKILKNMEKLESMPVREPGRKVAGVKERYRSEKKCQFRQDRLGLEPPKELSPLLG